jgi:glycosyltransferase involved in cell wall biosynthesis
VRYLCVAPGTGYGDAADQYVAGLRHERIPVSWVPTGDVPAWAQHGDIRDADVDYDTLIVHDRPSELDSRMDHERDVTMLGYIAWEADIAPGGWRHALDGLDLVLVPSTFNQKAVVATGTTTPVAVLPHIARSVRPIPGGCFGDITADDFVFYAMGPWYNRKALDDVIRVFLDTFTADDSVGLIVKTSPIDYGAPDGRDARTWVSVGRLLGGHTRPPKIVLKVGDGPPGAIDQIHTRGDCFVSLARGEGWGLGAFDAASFGNPSIATGWGGHLDYLGSDYPLLVDYKLVPTAADPIDAFGFPQSDDSYWAHADRNHAGALMRHVYEQRHDAMALGAELRRRISDQYAPAVVTSRLISLIAQARQRAGASLGAGGSQVDGLR